MIEKSDLEGHVATVEWSNGIDGVNKYEKSVIMSRGVLRKYLAGAKHFCPCPLRICLNAPWQWARLVVPEQGEMSG